MWWRRLVAGGMLAAILFTTVFFYGVFVYYLFQPTSQTQGNECLSGLDTCSQGLARCSGRLEELERVFHITPAKLPPVPPFAKKKETAP